MSNIIPVKDVQVMAANIAKSGLFGINSPEQAMALMLVAQAEGMHPATAARDYDIIKGRPAKKSEAMLRSFLESGGTVKWEELTDKCAKATFSHPAGGEVTIDWTIERAQQAGLIGNQMWNKYPRNMLRARCVSEGVRTVCPMATSGMYVPEEVQQFEDRPKQNNVKDVTPAEPQTFKLEEVLAEIEMSETIEELKGVYTKHYKLAYSLDDAQAITAMQEAKDKCKQKIENENK